MRGTLSVRRLVPAMNGDEAFALLNSPTLLTRNDVDTIVTESEIGLRPDGEPLYVLIKDALPYDLCAAAYPLTMSAANATIIGGIRAIAAGAYLEPRILKDGSQGRRNEIPFTPRLVGARNGMLGFFEKPKCHMTAFTANNWERFEEEVMPLARCVDEVFRQYLPARYAAQAEAASLVEPRFVIAGTVFSTITTNRNWVTAVHTDSGDLRNGFGVQTLLTAGDFEGGGYAFPQYRVAIDARMTDVLLADVHQPHGNLPIIGEMGQYERVSLIFYLREAMMRVCPAPRPFAQGGTAAR
jgi:hypothetical protein